MESFVVHILVGFVVGAITAILLSGKLANTYAKIRNKVFKDFKKLAFWKKK
jgi:gas vesicle protein